MSAAVQPEPATGAPASPKASSPPPLDPFVEEPVALDPVEEGAPAWTTTFGDMMSLLLTFFILLFSMSEIEVEKFKLAAESLAEGLGSSMGELLPAEPPEGVAEPDSAQVIVVDRNDVIDRELDEIAKQLQEFVEENELESTVAVERGEHGVFLRIRDVALFPPGSADFEEGNRWVVQQLGDITRLIGATLVVSGHTDTIPIAGARFASNWELSAARAAGVARTLVEMGHDPGLVTVEAFGEYRPLVSNDTPEGRGKNRRVELFYSRRNVAESLAARGAIPADSTGIAKPAGAGEQ